MTYVDGMMVGVGIPRQIIKAATTKVGAVALKRFAERYGMKEYVVAGKLFDWFGQQDDVFQRAVMGMLEGLERDAATEFMRRLAAMPHVDVLQKGTPGSKAKPESDRAKEQVERKDPSKR